MVKFIELFVYRSYNVFMLLLTSLLTNEFLNKRTVNITTSFYNFLSSSDGHVLYIIWITVICNWNKHIVKCVVSSRQLCIREVTFKSPVLNPFPELSLFTSMLAIAEFCRSNGRFRLTKRHYYWCAHVVSSKKS